MALRAIVVTKSVRAQHGVRQASADPLSGVEPEDRMQFIQPSQSSGYLLFSPWLGTPTFDDKLFLQVSAAYQLSFLSENGAGTTAALLCYFL